MFHLRRRFGLILLICFIIMLLDVNLFYSSANHGGTDSLGDLEQPGEVKLSFRDVVEEKVGVLRRSYRNSWQKVKSMVNQLQTNLFPPNIDFRSRDDGLDGTGEKMKEAAEKSFETSKVTVEETAKSAAKVIGEAMHKTAYKAKELKPSSKDDDDKSHEAEL